MEEAESLGLVAVSVVGVILFSSKSYFISKGWLGQGYIRDLNSGLASGTGQAEAFERYFSSTNNSSPLKYGMYILANVGIFEG